jgi:hypothetical protein
LDARYELYCLTDPVFYDSPLASRGDDVDFEIAGRCVPEGWRREEFDDWLVYRPEPGEFSLQGWKIHVSACLDNAAEVLHSVFDYCTARRIPFKFVRSRQLLLLRNGKNADRASSGKFATIYPAGEAQLEVILTELGALLEGQRGPYILSDLRWGAGPLYVRYGGFAGRWCLDVDGKTVAAIQDPDGTLVPDRRGPSFKPPPWVALPAFLEPHLAARASARVDELPFRIERALHFSNGGGVYAGVDTAGAAVVLKEARPHAGLDADGTDAVARLAHEADMLRRLAGIDAVPGFRGTFTVGDHHFLAMDLVEGTQLRTALVARYPLLVADPDPAAVAGYTSWAIGICEQVEATIAEVHRRGIVIRDLHAYNILVGPDDRIRLIDFEVAVPEAEARRPSMAHPGFAAPAGQSGFAIDRYALACLRLFVFLPITQLIGLDRAKSGELAGEIAELFPVPPAFLDDAVETIGAATAGTAGAAGAARQPLGLGKEQSPRPPRTGADPARWPELRDSMAAAIFASATPERADRLFPGDIKQFSSGALGIAYGAAGVLYALALTGAARRPDLEDWLVERALHPEPGTSLGLYDGLHGVAHVLEILGRRSEARAVLQICLDETSGKLDRFGLDLLGGLAGIGLNLAWFSARTGDPALHDAAMDVAQRVAERLGAVTDVPETSGGRHPYAGLTRGSSGPALLFLRLFEASGDPALLDLAAIGIGQDLRRCARRPEGSLQVDEGWRQMPYLSDGSVGIGFVVDDYLRHRPDERFAEAAAAIRLAAEGVFFVEPGLFYGRAGMLLYLSRRHAPGQAWQEPVVARHLKNLAWHAVGFQGHLAFPGEELLRLSMDLASGTAGVLLAAGAALAPRPVGLPFLPPAASPVPDAIATPPPPTITLPIPETMERR